MQLQLFSSTEIDKQKWDDCLKESSNQLIYASSVYLDYMADNWDGIIGDDYNLIMPIPWRKKYGIKYCYHAPFIQQTGVFAKAIEDDEVRDCLKLMLQYFKYGDYSLNFMNTIKSGKSANNYMLSLASNYRSTSFFYSEDLKANLSKASKYFLIYEKGNAEEAINLFRELYGEKFPNVISVNYKNFYDLCELKATEGNLIVRKISLDKRTVSMNLLLKDKHRIYSLMHSTTSEGRNISAGHFLLDNIIKEFSQTGLVFDFEGSDIPGVEHFIKSFGAINQPYSKIHFNRLPYLLRLFKR